MKTIKAVLLPLAAKLSALSGEIQRQVIKLGIDPTFPPLEYKNSTGQADRLRRRYRSGAVRPDAQAKCVWVKAAGTARSPACRRKKFDAIASSMTITPQRRRQIAFSSKVSNAPARLVAHKGSNLQPTVASLKGKSVGVQQGSSRRPMPTRCGARPASTWWLTKANRK